VVLVADFHAFVRGHREGQELCHVVGGGPVPISVARRLAVDAFVKVVLHDGVQIHTVAHVGRHIPAELGAALELGALPELDGVTCGEDACDRRYGLEWDHVDPVANGGETSFDNVQPRCWPHHREKTARDREAGLLGTGRGTRAPP
jgi:HNH endonuclease